MRKRWLLSIVIMLFPFVASFAADPEEGKSIITIPGGRYLSNGREAFSYSTKRE